MPIFDVSALDPSQSAIKLVSEDLVRKHGALPLFKRGGRLFVGIADPTNTRALDEIKFHTNLTVEPILVDEERIKRTIDQWLESADALADAVADSEGLEDLEVSGGDDEFGADTGVDAKGDDTPVVKFINKVLVDAIRRGASDVHFEPYETDYRVRLRIDGLLKQVAKVPVKLQSAHRRAPEGDGAAGHRREARAAGRPHQAQPEQDQADRLPRQHAARRCSAKRSCCVSSMASAAKLGIDKLGYEEDQKKLFLDAVQKPYGMVLVTGPTGSGKTVSLYTALNILNDDTRNISTVEDPVEIRVPGINQVQMNVKRGMTFAAALRSFLRQDPDVIMVGEIRDLETAEIAIKAAQTGHMVLSTLHTNDAPQTISRLMNMGVAPFNITSSVTLVIAQRLARRLHDCKRDAAPARACAAGRRLHRTTKSQAGITLYEAVGCQDCTEGYKGRTGIYQVMPMTDEIQAIVLAGGNVHADRRSRAAIRRPRPAPVGAAQGQERRHQPRRNQPRHQGLTHGRDPHRRQDRPVRAADPADRSSSGKARTSAAPR